MPADVWQPVHFVPAFMGYSTTQTVAVTNAGYPRCADISSPNISSCHTGLMYGMSCSVVVNYGSHYYSNCDASGGHSGSGTFFTSAGTRYLIGNLKGGPSNAACPNGTCTTYDSGTSSWLFDFQSEMRNTYFALTF
jgi:hypothetical protein